MAEEQKKVDNKTPQKKPKPKSKLQPEDDSMARLSRQYRNFASDTKTLFRSIVSKDSSTRKVAGFFIVCFFVTLTLATLNAAKIQSFINKNFGGVEDKSSQAGNLERMISKQEAAIEARVSTLEIGRFTVEVSRGGVVPGKSPAVLNIAEVRVVVDCDNKETCLYIKNNLPKARDQISTIITTVDMETLMSGPGKRDLRNNIRRALNQWLPKGKVENVYFTDVTMG